MTANVYDRRSPEVTAYRYYPSATVSVHPESSDASPLRHRALPLAPDVHVVMSPPPASGAAGTSDMWSPREASRSPPTAFVHPTARRSPSPGAATSVLHPSYTERAPSPPYGQSTSRGRESPTHSYRPQQNGPTSDVVLAQKNLELYNILRAREDELDALRDELRATQHELTEVRSHIAASVEAATRDEADRAAAEQRLAVHEAVNALRSERDRLRAELADEARRLQDSRGEVEALLRRVSPARGARAASGSCSDAAATSAARSLMATDDSNPDCEELAPRRRVAAPQRQPSLAQALSTPVLATLLVVFTATAAVAFAIVFVQLGVVDA